MVSLEEAMQGSVREVTLQRGGGKVETYRVKVPAGVREGQRIRLAGRGEAGASGGESGDLYLRVRLARHPDLRVEGCDLVTDVEMAPWEMVLGGSVPVRTLAGVVMLKVPAGAGAGQKLRLRGQGLPREDGGVGICMPFYKSGCRRRWGRRSENCGKSWRGKALGRRRGGSRK